MFITRVYLYFFPIPMVTQFKLWCFELVLKDKHYFDPQGARFFQPLYGIGAHSKFMRNLDSCYPLALILAVWSFTSACEQTSEHETSSQLADLSSMDCSGMELLY